MKIFKNFWSKISRRIWFIVSTFLLLILYVASVVVTQIPLISVTLDTVFAPGENEIISGAENAAQYYRYVNDEGIETKEEALAYGNAVNEEIASEGFTLLKNEDNVLPLESGAKISIFGQNSAYLVYGGSGSGGMDSSSAKTIAQALKDDGFNVNETLENFYKSSDYGRTKNWQPQMGNHHVAGTAIGEAPVNEYTSNVVSSFNNYKDAALVVFSRVGGEGFDLPRRMAEGGSSDGNKDTAVSGARSVDDHYLQLDQNETDLLDKICNDWGFENVIVIINCATSMELGFLDDPTHYAYHEEIKGAVWIGAPGGTGINALGDILKGDITPSGRTVDLYARDFKKDPTWNNVGDYSHLYGGARNSNAYVAQVRNNWRPQIGPNTAEAHFVEYEEGIYIGYRYYETRGYEEAKADSESTWYDDSVVFPFGYGLSYSTFEWEIVNSTSTEAPLLEDSEISITVKVTNTSPEGSKPAKDVVQLYYTPKYYAGGIEKAHKNLGDFAKTKEIGPGEDDEVTLTISLREMASYDYSDANGNGFKGYEAEEGEYILHIAKNSHESVEELTYNVATGVQYRTDEDGDVVENQFDDVSGYFHGEFNYFDSSADVDVKLMSRADFAGTFPTYDAQNGHRVTSEFMTTINGGLGSDDASDPWYVAESEKPTQSSSALTYEETEGLRLYDMIGLDYDDPKWDDFLNQLTLAEMSALIGSGNFHTEGMENIQKPRTLEPDGPVGFTNFMAVSADLAPVYDTVFYASECVIGATWNVELGEKMGNAVGNEGLIGNARGDGTPYSGWYAPALNIHRSPFSGRNWEYYSEDPILSGKMAVGVVKGASEKGIYTYLKHFALNDQESHRDANGILTWANEQTMREIYFKPFELAIKDGGARGVMSSFNRIGMTWAGGSYALLTEVLRNEWGFKGVVVTDYATGVHMNIDQMVRAGGDLWLMQGGAVDYGSQSATTITAMRNAVKNIMYITANSAAMNGYGDGVRWGIGLAGWNKALNAVVIALTVLFVAIDIILLIKANLEASKNKHKYKGKKSKTYRR